MVSYDRYWIWSRCECRQTHIMKNMDKEFSQHGIGRIIEMAWEDRTPFEAVKHNSRIIESAVSDVILFEIRNLF
jgi:hypothetical protein